MKYTDTTWDFRKADTKKMTHCFHSYPAMMIPQIAERLLNKYGQKTKKLFDPYCGTGTSLVEANIKNIEAIGTDLNPLARLIAKTKTTILDIQLLDLYLRDFNDMIFAYRFGVKNNLNSIVLPNFDNINFWFNKSSKIKLAFIKSFIDNIKQEDIKNFFLTAFSETVRESSLTKKGEFKLIRIPPKIRETYDPDSFGLILSKLERNKKGLKEFMEAKINSSNTSIYDFNTVSSVPDNIVENESIDIIVTSPPYGDSKTTVAYGQYSRLANQWMGINNASSVDNKLMGGVKHTENIVTNSKHLTDTLNKISDSDYKRAKEVESFFIDYKKSIDNVSKTIKKDGFACYVVGNRTVKGVNIPMDEVTKYFFTENGFEYKETIVRNIPNKRMPSENSPTNIIGKKSSTMKQEFIVVMEKR